MGIPKQQQEMKPEEKPTEVAPATADAEDDKDDPTKESTPVEKSDKPTPKWLVDLREEIDAQAVKVRDMRKVEIAAKRAWRENVEILEEVKILLDLKFKDPAWINANPPKSIKIRWRIRNKANKVITFQRPFPGRTFVLGSEIKAAISEYTHKPKKLPDHPKFCSFELVNKVDGKKTYEPIEDDKKYRLTLHFPGPVYEDCMVLMVRARVPGQEDEEKERAIAHQKKMADLQKAKAERLAKQKEAGISAGAGRARGRGRGRGAGRGRARGPGRGRGGRGRGGRGRA